MLKFNVTRKGGDLEYIKEILGEINDIATARDYNFVGGTGHHSSMTFVFHIRSTLWG